MQKKSFIFLLAITVVIVQAACSVGSSATQPSQPTQDVNAAVQTGVALTQAANMLVVPTGTMAPVVILPTVTSAPVLPTNTVAPAVSGVINYTANCRSGPGANFPALIILNPGTQVTIAGTNKATDGSLWWIVQSAGNPDCWLVDGALTITGNKSSVVVVVSPPTPTPVPLPDWNGTWTFWMRGGFSGASDATVEATLIQSGSTLTSLPFYVFDGSSIINATVSADGMTVNGSVTITRFGFSYDLPLVFKRVPGNPNQFRGSWYNSGSGGAAWDGDWCGAINGAGEPSPCKQN